MRMCPAVVPGSRFRAHVAGAKLQTLVMSRREEPYGRGPELGRPATPNDVGEVTETLTLAFLHDPVWSVALARSDGSMHHHAAFWQLYVEGALRHSTVFMAEGGAAVSVWIPPGETELSTAGEEAIEGLVRSTLEPAGQSAMFELWERFAANHPRDEPHAYLSLLATHPDHRGRGLGQRLLAEALMGWDAAGVPAYLESTNPVNDHRYERAGFRRIGGFRAVLDDAPISTMWRAAPTKP
jgi:GNAT superfamily N-acetyltransferase